MRMVNLTAKSLILASLLACGDSSEGDDGGDSNGTGGDNGGQTSDAGDSGVVEDGGDSNGGETGGANNQTQNGGGTDKLSGAYMPGTADALMPMSGFVFTDPRDQNQDQQAYKIILSSEPSVGCKIKELDERLGKLDRFGDGVEKIRYLSCRLRATDMSGRHPAAVLGVDIGGFVALPPDQLECAPTFSMMGKSAGDRVIGSMKWVDAQRNGAEVASFEFDLTYCGEVDTLSM